MSRGVETRRDNDSIYRFVALEPYTRHLLNVSESGLQQISWRLPYKTIGVYADPNSVKRVFIPVLPMGELEGQISKVNKNGELESMSRIPVVIADLQGNVIARVSSDPGGMFNYTELKPGKYKVYVDAEAMERAGFSASPMREVEIKPSVNGDYIQGIDFVIVPKMK